MANYKKTKTQGRYTRSGGAGKVIAWIIVAVILTAGVFAGGWFASKQYYPNAPKAILSGGVIDDQGKDITQGVHQLPKGMTFLAENAAGVTLTAHIEPVEAADLWDWSAAWVNPASAWATGKTVTEFVTVTPSADGASTATVACRAAFGEMVNVRIASRNDPEVYGDCAVNYMKRIEGATLVFGEKNTPGNTNRVSASGFFLADSGCEYDDMRFEPVYGVGTVSPTLGDVGFRRSVGRSLAAAFDAAEGLDSGLLVKGDMPVSLDSGLKLPNLIVDDLFREFSSESNPYSIASYNIWDERPMRNGLSAALDAISSKETNAEKSVIVLRLDLPYSYGSVEEMYKGNYYIGVDPETVRIYATNVSIGGGSVTF